MYYIGYIGFFVYYAGSLLSLKYCMIDDDDIPIDDKWK